jgi:hypothetical protein
MVRRMAASSHVTWSWCGRTLKLSPSHRLFGPGAILLLALAICSHNFSRTGEPSFISHSSLCPNEDGDSGGLAEGKENHCRKKANPECALTSTGLLIEGPNKFLGSFSQRTQLSAKS